MHRTLLIVLFPSLISLIAWATLPGTLIDKALFFLSAKTIANPPFFITGNGTHESPHTLRTLRSFSEISKQDLPFNIAISDDPERIFQSSPPSPVDFAIILKNLRRLGAQNITISTPLSWQETDHISLIALEQQLDAFSSPITSAPLTRNPVPTSIPAAFRRASLPLQSINGDISSIPIINRISIPDIILGNKTSLAGFTILESESQTKHPHLIARWDDRIVFSILLLTTIDHFKSSLNSIAILPGKYISLSPNGPYIPIDSFGRLTTLPPPIPRSELSPIQAVDLIDAPDVSFPHISQKPVIIRNTLSSADETDLAYSDSIVPTIATLTHPNGTTNARFFHRFPWLLEILLLASLTSLLFYISASAIPRKQLVLSSFIPLILVLHFIIFTTASLWPPTLPAITTIITTAFLSKIRKTNEYHDKCPEIP